MGGKLSVTSPTLPSLKAKMSCQDDPQLVEVVESTDPSFTLSQDGYLNHMMNPEILRHVFKVCELRDMFNIRLVCKFWHSLTLARFWNEATLVIGVTPGVVGLRWDRLWKELDFTYPPFRNYHLRSFEFCKNDKGKEKGYCFNISRHGKNWNYPQMQWNMEHFFSKYGWLIRRLKLSRPVIFSMKSFRKAIFKQLPILEELSLEGVRTKKYGVSTIDDIENPGSFLAHLFIYAEVQNYNLESFTVDALPVGISWYSIFRHFPKIQNLDINSEELQRIFADLNRLTTRIMNIKGLRVHFGPPLLDEHELERLTNLPHFQLETVSVCIDSSRWRDGWNTATNLTELLLQGYACPYPDFHFLEQLPHLKVLKLGKCDQKMLKDTVFQRLEIKVSLPHLYYFEVGLTLGVEETQMFAKVMPNVEILKTCLTTEGFRVVCRKWRRTLRELQLRSLSDDISTEEAVGDEGLTGIVDGCDLLLSNITDLKYLECLYIGSEGKISDTSVWNGFLKAWSQVT